MKIKQFAVIGLGRFGTSVALSLARMGYEVLGIDTNEIKVDDILDEVTHAVQADALDEEALRAVGIRNFDVVIVSIGHNMEASILTTVMLKEMGVKMVVAKAQTDLHGRVLAKVGADKVVFPERDMGNRLARNLVSKNILDQIDLSPDFSLIELVAPEELLGKNLAEAKIRKKYGINVLAIRRGSDILIAPDAETSVREGDLLVAIGRNEDLWKFGGD